MSEQGKDSNQNQYHHHPDQYQPPPPPPHQYGTFQGVHNYPPPPVIGFPQPTPPSGVSGGYSVDPYIHGYQAVPGYAVAEGRPVREQRLPCCGIGIGWFLFILGFFFAAFPWYIGAFILLCAQIDEREKPGYVACVIAAILGTVAVIFGVTSA